MNLPLQQRLKLHRLLFPALTITCLIGASLVLRSVPLEKDSRTTAYGQGTRPSMVLTSERAWGQPLDLAGRPVISLSPKFATYWTAFSGEIELLLLSGNRPPRSEGEIQKRLMSSQRVGPGKIADNVFFRFYLDRGKALKIGKVYLIIRVKGPTTISPLSVWLDRSPDWRWPPIDYLILRDGLVQAHQGGQDHLVLVVQHEVILTSLWNGIFKYPWGVWLALGTAALCLLLPAVLLQPFKPGTEPGRINVGGRRIAFTLLGSFLLLAFLEGLGALFVHIVMPPSYAVARMVLLGQATALEEQSYLPQPYLCYIPTPGFKRSGMVQHNQDGYRGERVPLQRTEGALRILCLGGSTTYGSLVASPKETYPARLKELLAGHLPSGYSGVEVINGGLESGSTAELMTLYHFKYHYYRPDIVIIHTGANDAVPALKPQYQPDYSHWRENMTTLRPLPPHSRWLANSRLVSVFIIKLFYSDLLDRALVYRDRPPVADWYAPERTRLNWQPGGSAPNPAFAHNLEGLINLIMLDGAKILLLPMRLSPYHRQGQGVVEQVELNNQVMLSLAQKYRLPVAPFPVTTISKENWGDDVHLTAPGIAQKAAYVAGYIRQVAAGEMIAAADPDGER